jgi:hypothetical protein
MVNYDEEYVTLYACKLEDSDIYLNHRDGWFVELNGLSHSRRNKSRIKN